MLSVGSFPYYCFDKSPMMAMSDKAALVLLHPKHIPHYLATGEYGKVYASLLIFPCFVPFIEINDNIMYPLLVLCYRLQLQYKKELFNTEKYAANVKQYKPKKG